MASKDGSGSPSPEDQRPPSTRPGTAASPMPSSTGYPSYATTPLPDLDNAEEVPSRPPSSSSRQRTTSSPKLISDREDLTKPESLYDKSTSSRPTTPGETIIPASPMPTYEPSPMPSSTSYPSYASTPAATPTPIKTPEPANTNEQSSQTEVSPTITSGKNSQAGTSRSGGTLQKDSSKTGTVKSKGSSERAVQADPGVAPSGQSQNTIKTESSRSGTGKNPSGVISSQKSVQTQPSKTGTTQSNRTIQTQGSSSKKIKTVPLNAHRSMESPDRDSSSPDYSTSPPLNPHKSVESNVDLASNTQVPTPAPRGQASPPTPAPRGKASPSSPHKHIESPKPGSKPPSQTRGPPPPASPKVGSRRQSQNKGPPPPPNAHRDLQSPPFDNRIEEAASIQSDITAKPMPSIPKAGAWGQSSSFTNLSKSGKGSKSGMSENASQRSMAGRSDKGDNSAILSKPLKKKGGLFCCTRKQTSEEGSEPFEQVGEIEQELEPEEGEQQTESIPEEAAEVVCSPTAVSLVTQEEENVEDVQKPLVMFSFNHIYRPRRNLQDILDWNPEPGWTPDVELLSQKAFSLTESHEIPTRGMRALGFYNSPNFVTSLEARRCFPFDEEGYPTKDYYINKCHKSPCQQRLSTCHGNPYAKNESRSRMRNIPKLRNPLAPPVLTCMQTYSPKVGHTKKTTRRGICNPYKFPSESAESEPVVDNDLFDCLSRSGTSSPPPEQPALKPCLKMKPISGPHPRLGLELMMSQSPSWPTVVSNCREDAGNFRETLEMPLNRPITEYEQLAGLSTLKGSQAFIPPACNSFPSSLAGNPNSCCCRPDVPPSLLEKSLKCFAKEESLPWAKDPTTTEIHYPPHIFDNPQSHKLPQSMSAYANDSDCPGRSAGDLKKEKASAILCNVPAEYECLQIDYLRRCLTCVLCNTVTKDFCMLSCLHYFCTACLLELYGDKDTTQNVLCPLCSEPQTITQNAVADLYKPQYLETMFLYFEKVVSDPVRICANHVERLVGCVGHPAADYICLSCGEYFCEFCKCEHLEENFNHVIKVITDTARENYKERARRSPMICNLHPNYKILFYCKPCMQVICKACSTGIHVCHDQVTIYDYIKDLNETCIMNKSKIIQKASSVVTKIAQEKDALQDLMMKKYEMCNQKITERTRETHIKIMTVQKGCYRYTNEWMQQQDEAYYYELTRLYRVRKAMKGTLVMLNTILAVACDDEALKLYDSFEEAAEFCTEWGTSIPHLKDSWTIVKLDEPKANVNISLALTSLVHHQYHIFQDCDMKIDSLVLCQDGNVVVACDPSPPNPVIQCVCPDFGVYLDWEKYVKNQVLFPAPCRMANIKWGDYEVLAVVNRKVDLKKKKNCIYNIVLVDPHKDGEKIREFTFQDEDIQPYAIGALRREGFIITDVGTERAPKIFKKNLTSLGLTYVTTCNTFDLLAAPSYICCNKNDDIIVSDEITQNIVIMNSMGQVMYVNRDFHHSSSKSIGGICTDNLGFIYVAVYNRNAIYKLTYRGKTVGPVFEDVHGVITPTDVCISRGKMFIASEHGVMVYNYP